MPNTDSELSANSATSSEPRSGIEVAESLLEAWRRKDFERAVALLRDEVECQFVPMPARHGKARVKRMLRGFMFGVREIDVIMHHMVEQDGVVLTERTDILRGPWLDLEF